MYVQILRDNISIQNQRSVTTVRRWSSPRPYFSSPFFALCRPPLGTEGEEQMWTLVGSVPLVKYGPKPNIRPQKNLLTGTSTRSHGEDSEDAAANTAAGGHKAKYISFWKPEVGLMLLGCTLVDEHCILKKRNREKVITLHRIKPLYFLPSHLLPCDSALSCQHEVLMYPF